MAVAIVTPVAGDYSVSNLRTSGVTYTFSTSYATGGESLTPAQLGLQTVHFAHVLMKTPGTGSVTSGYYDVATSKLKANLAAAEVSNATDLSAVTVEVIAYGR